MEGEGQTNKNRKIEYSIWWNPRYRRTRIGSFRRTMSSEDNESENSEMKGAAAPVTTTRPSTAEESPHTDQNDGVANGNDKSPQNDLMTRLPEQFQDCNDEKDPDISNLSMDDLKINPTLNTSTATSTTATPSRMPPITSSSISTPSSTATTTRSSTSSPNLLNSLIASDGLSNLNRDCVRGHGVDLVAAVQILSEVKEAAVACSSTMDAHQYAIQQEMEGIKLLRQIFPGESPQELRQLYNEHVMQKANATLASAATSPTTTSNNPSSLASMDGVNTLSTPSPSSRRSIIGRNNFGSDGGFGPKSDLGKRLLRQATEASDQEHVHRLDDASETKTTSFEDTSRLGLLKWQEVTLPVDFLRLPSQLAVRRRHCQEPTSPLGSAWRYQLVDELEQRALRQLGVMRYPIRQQYRNQNTEGAFFSSPTASGADNTSDGGIPPVYYTVVVYRDSKVGLGVTLREAGPALRVHALAKIRSSNTSNLVDADAGVTNEKNETDMMAGESTAASPPPGMSNSLKEAFGPSFRAGIRPGDILLGINGTAFRQSKSPNDSLLRHAVNTIRQSPDPIVLHLERHSPRTVTPLLDQVDNSVKPARTISPTMLPLQTIRSNNTSKNNQIRSPPRIPPRSSLLDEDESVPATTGNGEARSPQARADSMRISNESHHSSTKSPGRSKKSLPIPPAIHPFAKALAKRRLILAKQGKVWLNDHGD